MDRTLLGDLNVFVTIVRRGSLTQAAIELDVSPSAVSHRLRRLENELGVRLLHRTNRTIHPTETGAVLAEELASGFQAISDAMAAAASQGTSPKGRLRLTVPRDAARLVLAPVLVDFGTLYPDMHLDIIVEDSFTDIVVKGYDAGIRYGDRVPTDMVGIALTAKLDWVVVASPDLIARVGLPKEPSDLLTVPCVQMRTGDGSSYLWELGNSDAMVRLDVKGPICVNETEQTVDAAIRGIGFGYCLARRVEAEVTRGDLQIVLPEWASVGDPLTIYYSSRRQPPVGLRQLVDLIRRREGLSPLIASV